MDAKHYIIRLYIAHINVTDEGLFGLERMRLILQQHWMTHLTTTLKQIILQLFHLQMPTTTT